MTFTVASATLLSWAHAQVNRVLQTVEGIRLGISVSGRKSWLQVFLLSHSFCFTHVTFNQVIGEAVLSHIHIHLFIRRMVTCLIFPVAWYPMVSFDTIVFLLLADSMEITKVFPYRNNDLLCVNVLIYPLNISAFTWFELESFKNVVIKSLCHCHPVNKFSFMEAVNVLGSLHLLLG